MRIHHVIDRRTAYAAAGSIAGMVSGALPSKATD
jgi:hypothetical protein